MTAPSALSREQVVKMLVDKFLAWPLPDSVCSDLCATKQGYPHRSGTSLLTADEAKQMLEYLLGEMPDAAQRETITRLEGENVDLHKKVGDPIQYIPAMKAIVDELHQQLAASQARVKELERAHFAELKEKLRYTGGYRDAKLKIEQLQATLAERERELETKTSHDPST